MTLVKKTAALKTRLAATYWRASGASPSFAYVAPALMLLAEPGLAHAAYGGGNPASGSGDPPHHRRRRRRHHHLHLLDGDPLG